MIQQARGSDSKSFLRELEFMTLLIQNKKDREYFLKKLSALYKKRNESIGTNAKTGATSLKTELLAYFQSKGSVETANIWARALPYNEKSINNLLLILQKQLMKQRIDGVLEVHLQDREINSPHIQFVGNNAAKAEQIIAMILVHLKYETDMESALSKKRFTPYFETNDKAPYPKYNELRNKIDYYKKITSEEANLQEIQELLDSVDSMTISIKKRLQKIEVSKKEVGAFNKRLQELIKTTKHISSNQIKITNLRNERLRYKMRRLRRRKRR